MENARLHFVGLLATYSLFTRYCLSAEDEKPCNRKQNGTIGGVGIIQCSFESRFNVIVWSYAGDDTGPLVRYDHGVFQSNGNESTSYSLRIDGALLIIDAATRTGSKEYKVETLNIDGEPKEQIVEYQFMGESTTIRHPTTVSTTTCPVTETTSCGCQGKNEGSAVHWALVVLGFVVGIVVGGGAGVVANRKGKKDRKDQESVSKGTNENDEKDKCIPGNSPASS